MRLNIAGLLLCAGCFAALPVRAEIRADQFAYGLQLKVSGEQAVYELELPLAVYQGSLRNDLGDIRVFNAAGQIVPYALRRPANETLKQDVATTDLPFFPLAERSGQLDDDLAIHVERTAAGTVVDVRTNGQQVQPQENQVHSYLLDASALKNRIETLELLWSAETPAFLADVVIETSSNLVRWQPLTTAAVARLSYQDYRLDQNQIRLPRANSRYLRLHWPVGQPLAKLTGVRVLTQQNYTIKRPAQRQLKMTAELTGDRHYSVDLQGALPVSAVRISLPDKNSLAAVRLFSADNLGGNKRERWHGLAYNLKTDGNSLTNPKTSLPPWRQRYWELTLDPSEAPPGTAPRIEFFWQPERLTFLAQGEGPYLLAYGSNSVGPTDFPLANLLNSSLPTAQPQLIPSGEAFSLGGKQALVATTPPVPWREYSLWIVLGLGVLLIGGMSFSLYRKLHDTERIDKD